jgi:hypothetical protein
MQKMCPASPAVPPSTEAQREFCLADLNSDLPFTDASTGAHFDACVGAALNTECSATRLHSADGDPIVPDRCLNRTEIDGIMSFGCPAGSNNAPQRIHCSFVQRQKECDPETFCGDGSQVWSSCLVRKVVTFILFCLKHIYVHTDLVVHNSANLAVLVG